MKTKFAAAFASIFLCIPPVSAQMIVSRCETLDSNADAAKAAPPQEIEDSFMPQWFEDLAVKTFRKLHGKWDHSPEAVTRYNQTEVDLNMWVAARKWERDGQWRGACRSKNQFLVVWAENEEPVETLKAEDVRASYNLCDFWQGDRRQLPLNMTRHCRPIADPKGYTINELKARYEQANRTARGLQATANGLVLGSGTVAGGALFRMGRLPYVRTVLGGLWGGMLLFGVPVAVSGWMVYTDSAKIAQELMDIRNAAKLSADTEWMVRMKEKLVVTMPMEDFVEHFTMYLDSIHPRGGPVADVVPRDPSPFK